MVARLCLACEKRDLLFGEFQYVKPEFGGLFEAVLEIEYAFVGVVIYQEVKWEIPCVFDLIVSKKSVSGTVVWEYTIASGFPC